MGTAQGRDLPPRWPRLEAHLGRSPMTALPCSHTSTTMFFTEAGDSEMEVPPHQAGERSSLRLCRAPGSCLDCLSPKLGPARGHIGMQEDNSRRVTAG